MDDADAAANGNGVANDNPGFRLFGALAEASLIQQRRRGEDPDRADTLPRTTLRASSRAQKLIDPAGDLQELYDPDSIGKQFYHPAEEILRHAYVPIATKEGRYYDPPSAHRIQTVVGWTKDHKPILKEHIVRSGKDLKALSESREYKRSRLLESTGDWDMSDDAMRYKRFVETPLRAAWHEAWKPDQKDRTRLRESSSDGFAFGADDGNWGGGQGVMGAMNQEFIPVTGGPFNKQLYLYAHWEASAKCFEMKNHSEYAKATVDIVTDFALGRGVNWKIKSPRAKLIWEEFWQRNKMEDRIRQMCDDAVWQGELLVRKTEPLKGFMQVRSCDPSSFYEIVTDPQDIETCYFYHQQFNCLHGDTEIALLDGSNPTVAELAARDAPYYVYSYDHGTKRIVPGLASKTWRQGRKRCVKVTLDNQESVTCSYDHPFLMRDGSYVWAEKLTPGSSLMPLYRRTSYEQVWQPETGWEFTHHMAAGGSPPTGMVVHHKNHVRSDNQPTNLEKLDRLTHMAMHRGPRARMARSAGKRTPEALAQLRETQRKRYARSPDLKQRASKRAKQQWADGDTRRKMAAGVSQSRTNPSDKLKTLWGDQGWKDRISEATSSSQKKAWEGNTARREKASQAAKARWADPELRVRMLSKGRAQKAEWREAAARESVVNHKVVSVEDVGDHDVYDVQVDEYGNFGLTAGAIVHNTQYQLPYTEYNGRYLDIPLQQYVIQQIPPTEMWHGKLNVTAYEKWGRSDFFCALGTLKRLRDWTNAATLKDLLQANLVWIVTIHGDDADVQAFVNNSQNAQLPPFAGTVVTNDAMKYESFHQDTAGGSRMGRGSTGEFLISTYAASQHFPSSYFNLGSSGMARATALVASEPIAKKIASRQQFFRALLDHLYEEVMKRATEAGRVAASEIAAADADPEWTFPSTFEEDRGAKFRDLGNATDRRWISHRRAATVGAQELGFEEFDYDEERQIIAGELQDSILQAQPLPIEPPATAKPSGFGASDGATPPGGREEVKGATAKANFKQDTRGAPSQSTPPVKKEAGPWPMRGLLSEADRANIRHSVRLGLNGGEIITDGQ